MENKKNLRILIVSNCDGLARLVTRNFRFKNVEIVGVIRSNPSFKKKISILSKAIKKKSLKYALYLQFEMLLAGYHQLLSKIFDIDNLTGKNINTLQTSNFHSIKVVDFAKKSKAELILSIRPALIFPAKTITELPPIVNLHCSLLPSFGGIGSVLQALSAGKDKLGISFHLVESEKIDDGIVVHQSCININKKKSVYWHTYKLYQQAGKILQRNAIDICNNALNKKLSNLEKVEKSYFSWPSENCFLNLHNNGFSLLTLKDLKFKI
jgi:hypothetical protein